MGPPTPQDAGIQCRKDHTHTPLTGAGQRPEPDETLTRPTLCTAPPIATDTGTGADTGAGAGAQGAGEIVLCSVDRQGSDVRIHHMTVASLHAPSH